MPPRKRRAEQAIAPPPPAVDPASDIDEPVDDELDPAVDPAPAGDEPAAANAEAPQADGVRRGSRPGLRLRRGDRRNRFCVQSEG